MAAEPGGVDALCAGETLMVLRSSGSVRLGARMHPSIAGAESNVAIGLARLGHRASWCGVLGADQAGLLIERTLRAEGVDTTEVRRDETGFTGILVREDRLPNLTRVDYHRRGSAGSTLDTSDVLSALEHSRPRVVHVTGITPALSNGSRAAILALVQQARRSGVRVTLDVNHRRRLWSDDEARAALRPLLPHVDVLIGSVEELALVTDRTADPEKAARSLIDRGCQDVVVKRGAAGATAYTAEQTVSSPARRVTPVDTVGAGDAFTAGYLSGGLDDLDLKARLDRAIVLGAFAVASSGDWEGLPTRDELGLLDLEAGEVLR